MSMCKGDTKVSQFVEKARRIVYDYVVDHPDIDPGITMTDIYVVWFSKTLQNWKAVISTTIDDDKIYEVISNGDKGEIYLDVYRKAENFVINDEVRKPPTTQAGPHSDKCRVGPHAHGNVCHVSCPTCHSLTRI